LKNDLMILNKTTATSYNVEGAFWSYWNII